MSLTVYDKTKLLEGKDVWHTHELNDIPQIMMTDGPHGLRKQNVSSDNLGLLGSVPATCFPTASLLACSFDRKVLSRLGELMAKEAKAQKVNIVLGPGINMKRSPLCGRNFEYYSEDPFLAGHLAKHFVRSMEKNGVGTSVKHFFANNQETNRFFVDSIVDERALREIYLKAFREVIKENPATLMTSYNKINGYHGTEHPYLKKILRDEWKYDGVLVSDWGAVHNKIHSVKAGNDLEMPSSFLYHQKTLLEHYDQDLELRNQIDDSSKRIIQMAKKYQIKEDISFDINQHHQEARRLASESMVLVKNEDVLPLDKNQKILFIGDFFYHMRFQGGGSSFVNPTQIDQMCDIYQDYSKNIKHAKGYHSHALLEDETLINEAVVLAKEADLVVYLFGLPLKFETEGFDRDHLNIPKNQTQLIEKIYASNQNIVGVSIGGSVMNLSISKYFKGLLIAYLGGQASSGAILDILYGISNPSGRLAETWIDDVKSCNVEITKDNHAVYYDESIFIGYRYYHTFGKEVRYPFGFGLSYSKFDYKNIDVKHQENGFIVTLTVQNAGDIDGSEVVQVYLDQTPKNVYKAKRILVGFDKVFIKKKEEVSVEIFVSHDELKHYDIDQKRWILESNIYQISICKHSNDPGISFEFNISGESVQHTKTSYLNSNYDTSSFRDIYQKPLPPKSIKRLRPYHLSSTLGDIKNTFIGKIIANSIIKTGLKKIKNDQDSWVSEVAKKTLLETPIQTLVLFSAGEFTFIQAEGIVDIVNLKLIKGIKKMIKGKGKHV
jgi:beta-glucosidase